MILYPAIDILRGKAVRLVRGDFAAGTVYKEDPLEAARAWVEAGACFLHVVDLDGAREGRPENLEHLSRIVKELGVPVQYGGGLRSETAIEGVLEKGASRVILGTAAFTDPHLLGWALGAWPDKVLVSVDVRGGRVSTDGWTETIDGNTEDVIAGLQNRGVSNIVYTNVDRDGMLGGPDLEEVRCVARTVQGSMIYSGGIGSLADLEGLKALGEERLAGVIVGKALYEQRFTVEQALAVIEA